MKKKGSRKIDKLGRVTILKEIRDDLDLVTGDSMDFWVEGKKIIMQKNEEDCAICHNKNKKQLIDFEDTKICKNCYEKIFFSFEENRRNIEKSSNL